MKVEDLTSLTHTEPMMVSPEVFNQLGGITRLLHDTMQQLGVMPKLQSAADGLPDARSRLNYIATKTADAANKVLNSVEQAKAEHAAEREAHHKTRERAEKLESYLRPPEQAGPRLRGFSAFLSSMLREVNTGGLRESPLQALRKTYARIRRAAGHELGSGE